jgi:hypothetical protein
MIITQYIEYSLLTLLIYVIIRSTIRDRFNSEENKKSTPLIIILIGGIIFIFVNQTIGIITIVMGIALLIIPEKKNELIKEN